MDAERLERAIVGLAALDEPARRALYLYVASRQGDVSREEAARAVGVSRNLAGFHLDRLAAEGLLEVSFRRLTGRTGPGAGRPSKLYRRSARQIEVSLPPRRYELAARILATALDTSGAAEARQALGRTARRAGEHIGAEARARAGSRPSRKRLVEAMVGALAAYGYEPEQATRLVRLRNCPFHALVGEHKDLVCGMNLALIEGAVGELGLRAARPVLDPKPGMCCVCLELGPTPGGEASEPPG